MPVNDFQAPNEPADQGQSGGIDLRSTIGVFLRHWKLVVFIPLLAMAAAYGGLKLVPPLYKSTVEVLVVDPKQQVDGGVNRRLSSLDVDNTAMSNEITLLESRSLALRVAKELGLDQDQEFQRPGRLAMLAEKLGLSRLPWLGESFRDDRDRTVAADGALGRAAGLLSKRLQVERVQFSYVLAISVSSEDPAKAARLAQAFADDYLTEQANARTEAMRRTTDWLSTRLDELRGRLLQNDEAMRKIKTQGGLSDVGVGSNINQQQTSDINTQLTAARTDLAEKRARYEQARHLVDVGGSIQEISEVMSSGAIAQLRLQLTELSRKEAELRSQFGERYPEVISIRSQQEDIRKAMGAEVGRILGSMKNSYDAAARREQSLSASLQKLTTEHSDSPAYAKLRDLQPVADADRKAYESFLAQYNELSQRATFQDTGARIATPASLPDQPTSPRPVLVYALVGALSVAAGFTLAILVEFLDSGFKTGEQIEQAFGHNVIGMIPLMRTGPFHRSSDRYAVVQEMVDAPLSRLSEAVRTARVGLGLAQADGISKVILVTSSVPDEGKSTTATLLAVSSALSGKKTVLVDCDLRHKSISKAFGENHHGLAEVLMGEIDVTAVMVKDAATGTYVIPAGSSLRNPADLLTSQRMHDLLLQLRLQYDCIVVDASPLLAVIDALALAGLVDRILMVVEWNRTPRRGVAEALKVLRSQEHRVAGIVLTKVDFKRLRKYGYGYGAGFNYGRYYQAVEKYYTRP